MRKDPVVEDFMADIRTSVSELMNEKDYQDLHVYVEREDRGKYPSITIRVKQEPAGAKMEKVTPAGSKKKRVRR